MAVFGALSLHPKIPFPATRAGREAGTAYAAAIPTFGLLPDPASSGWVMNPGAGPAVRLFRIKPECLELSAPLGRSATASANAVEMMSARFLYARAEFETAIGLLAHPAIASGMDLSVHAWHERVRVPGRNRCQRRPRLVMALNSSPSLDSGRGGASWPYPFPSPLADRRR